jgi:streptogrisin C
MFDALRRDLKLNAADARTLLSRQDAALPVAQRLGTALGTDDFGGTWLDTTAQQLVVATTDPTQVGRIRAQGAQARVVARSQADLDAGKAALDRATAPAEATSWYVDVRANQIVLNVLPHGVAAARRFVRAAGVDESWVQVVPSNDVPTDDAGGDIIGGEKTLVSAGGYCSIGFAVEGGFVTAGHCGNKDDTTTGVDGSAQGTFKDRVFPGSDMALVETNDDWTLRPEIAESLGTMRIRGVGQAPVGWAICHSGAKTGWNCGTVTAFNVTRKRTSGNHVTGLTQTTACADGGDSGGPFVVAGTAQGMHSGRLNNLVCGDAGVHKSAFQPLQPALDTFKVKLLVSPGTVTAYSCGLTGPAVFTCSVAHNPGTVTINWEIGATPMPNWKNKKHVSGSCTPGRTTIVRVKVDEATEGMDAWQRDFVCR